MYYVVKYCGPFGFIKPWTAVRDGETFSQQFLTPSIIKGIELKLFPELLQNPKALAGKILRHKLSYDSVSVQTERTEAKAYTIKRKTASRQQSILTRGILINPVLHLAFNSYNDALIASKQHICLCRNEDVLLPAQNLLTMGSEDFDSIDGFELLFGKESGFMVGFNRFSDSSPMYGSISIAGVPVGREK